MRMHMPGDEGEHIRVCVPGFHTSVRSYTHIVAHDRIARPLPPPQITYRDPFPGIPNVVLTSDADGRHGTANFLSNTKNSVSVRMRVVVTVALTLCVCTCPSFGLTLTCAQTKLSLIIVHSVYS